MSDDGLGVFGFSLFHRAPDKIKERGIYLTIDRDHIDGCIGSKIFFGFCVKTCGGQEKGG